MIDNLNLLKYNFFIFFILTLNQNFKFNILIFQNYVIFIDLEAVLYLTVHLGEWSDKRPF